MREVLGNFELPWHLWVFFGFVVASIIFSARVRNEIEDLIAFMFGMKRRNKK